MADPIQKLSPTHELIASWILQNPDGTYRQMSVYFKYSIPWLCTVVNSDLFKAYMAERMKEINACVAQDIPAMLRATAVLAIERVTEVIEKSEDADTLIDAFDKVMHRYGYAPNSKASPAAQGGNIMQQNNVFYLNKDELKEVRGQLLESHAPRLALEVLPPAAQEEKVMDGLESMPTT